MRLKTAAAPLAPTALMTAVLRTAILMIAALMLACLTSCMTATMRASEIEEAALMLGQKHIENQQYPEAIAAYERALEQIDSKKLLYNRMLCLAYLGQWEQADEAGLQAQNLHPQTLEFAKARLEFFLIQEKTQEAIEVCAQILEADPYCEAAAETMLELYMKTRTTEETKALARTLARRGLCLKKASLVLLGEDESDSAGE